MASGTQLVSMHHILIARHSQGADDGVRVRVLVFSADGQAERKNSR